MNTDFEEITPSGALPWQDEARNLQKSSLISVHPRPSAVKIPNLESRLTGEVTIFYQTREILVSLGVSPRELRNFREAEDSADDGKFSLGFRVTFDRSHAPTKLKVTCRDSQP